MGFHLPTTQGQPHDREGEASPSPGLWRAGSAAARRSDWIEGWPRVGPRTASGRATVSWLRQLWLTLWLALFCMVGYYVISRYVISVVEVQGRSMVPTLKDGERYFLNRLAFYVRAPARGDLVVLRDPGHVDCAVKRIVGLPGDAVLIKDGDVYVNGERLPEPYLAPGTQTLTANRKGARYFLSRDSYFLLGDNRSCSEDSRTYGPVTRRDIVGLIPH